MLFELNKRYNITTLAPAVLGAKYQGLKVIGTGTIAEVDNANDLATLHAQLQSVQNILHDVPTEQLNFIKFINSDNEKIVLAKEWIDPTSVVVTNELHLHYIIKGVGTDDKVKITRVLQDLGYQNVEIREQYV